MGAAALAAADPERRSQAHLGDQPCESLGCMSPQLGQQERTVRSAGTCPVGTQAPAGALRW